MIPPELPQIILRILLAGVNKIAGYVNPNSSLAAKTVLIVSGSSVSR